MAGRTAFLASLLKDIKSERPKITEKDNLRLLFVTKWFLEYFLAVRAQEKGASAPEPWAFGLVGEVIERSWIVWVLKRMNSAVEEKVVSSTASFLLLLIHVSYRVACTAQVMDRAAGWNRVPDAAARAPRGDGLDGHRSGRGHRTPRGCRSTPATTRLQWPSPRRRARRPARIQGWHTITGVPALQRSPRICVDADAREVGQSNGRWLVCAQAVKAKENAASDGYVYCFISGATLSTVWAGGTDADVRE